MKYLEPSRYQNPALWPLIEFPITLEAWVYKFYNAGWNSIIGNGNPSISNYGLATAPNGEPAFYLNNNFHIAPITVPLEEWHHIAAVYDGTNVSIYLNGSLVYLGNDSPYSLNTIPANLIIGNNNQDNQHYRGMIDEVRIWNLALDESEIQSSMNIPVYGYEEGLSIYFNFNEGSGDFVLDQTPYSNQGFISPSTYWEEVGND